MGFQKLGVLASPQLALKRVPVYTRPGDWPSLVPTSLCPPIPGLPQPRIPLLPHHSQSDPHDPRIQETRLLLRPPQPASTPCPQCSLAPQTPLLAPGLRTFAVACLEHRPSPPSPPGAGGRAGGHVSPSRFPAPGGLVPCWKNPSRVPCALRRWGPQHTLR